MVLVVVVVVVGEGGGRDVRDITVFLLSLGDLVSWWSICHCHEEKEQKRWSDLTARRRRLMVDCGYCCCR